MTVMKIAFKKIKKREDKRWVILTDHQEGKENRKTLLVNYTTLNLALNCGKIPITVVDNMTSY